MVMIIGRFAAMRIESCLAQQQVVDELRGLLQLSMCGSCVTEITCEYAAVSGIYLGGMVTMASCILAVQCDALSCIDTTYGSIMLCNLLLNIIESLHCEPGSMHVSLLR